MSGGGLNGHSISCLPSATFATRSQFKLGRITRPLLAIRQKLAASKNIREWTLWIKTPSYSPWPRVEYLYFGRLWRLLVKLSQIKPNYSCFQPFMGHSQIITWYSTSILQFSDSAPTRLRLQSFIICLDDEPRVGTPLRRFWFKPSLAMTLTRPVLSKFQDLLTSKYYFIGSTCTCVSSLKVEAMTM